MANWTATLTAAIKDPSGQNSNIIVTVSFSNSVTNEVQTRQINGNNFTVSSLQAWAASVIASLNQRDTALAAAANAIAQGGPSVILATG